MADHSSPAAPRYYVPGQLVPKLIYLGCAILVTLMGLACMWEPTIRLIRGQVVEARIAEIHVSEPGKADIIYNYRRDYPEERNLEVTFSHYVAVAVDGREELFRISADSRKAPINFYNVNDRVRVAYYPHDPKRVAFAYEHARTWGAAGVILSVGLTMLLTAVPLVLAANKPILIDPEAPVDPQEAKE